MEATKMTNQNLLKTILLFFGKYTISENAEENYLEGID